MSHTAGRTGGLEWADHEPVGERALLLLHSLGADSTMWSQQVSAFSQVRRVVTIDLPGHGGSTAAPGEYRLEDLGHDILVIADSAGIDRFDLCGVSLGGLLALWLAIAAPERVLTLVASNTAARIGTPELWSERMRAVAQSGMRGISDTVLPRFFTPDFAERDPETLSRVESVFHSVDPVGYSGCCAALRDADLRAQVSQIACPSLIVVGDQDQATPPADGEFLCGRIAGSRLVVIPGAAHLANLDQPEAFTNSVMNAWSEW